MSPAPGMGGGTGVGWNLFFPCVSLFRCSLWGAVHGNNVSGIINFNILESALSKPISIPATYLKKKHITLEKHNNLVVYWSVIPYRAVIVSSLKQWYSTDGIWFLFRENIQTGDREAFQGCQNVLKGRQEIPKINNCRFLWGKKRWKMVNITYLKSC